MGMAASQARYLALSARKTNVEYEGQQINQSRLILSNKSADLFNQMLAMNVPTAPSSQDYTVLQYAYSDGNNDSVISNYYQLGTPEADYNYVVTSYHYENKYTGSRKLLQDPQIQATKTDHLSYDPDSTDNNKSVTIKKIWLDDGVYNVQTKDGVTKLFRPAGTDNEEDVKAINYGNNILKTDTVDLNEPEDKAEFHGVGVNSETIEEVTASEWTSCGATPSEDDKANIKKLFGVDTSSSFDATNYYKNVDNKYVYSTTAPQDDGTLQDVRSEGTVSAKCKEDIYAIYNVANPEVGDYYYRAEDGAYVTQAEYIASQADTTTKFNEGKGLDDGDTQTYYTDGTTFVKRTDLANTLLKYQLGEEPLTINYMTTTNIPEFSNYTAVGNSTLTQLTSEDLQKESIKAELEQIIKDMQGEGGSTSAAENFSKCFDEEGNYLGGIYTFQMSGVTYYTTDSDLQTSLASAYDTDAIAENGIDGQQSKLAYYNATYLQTKVEETKKALMETDGNGRFTTVKFEDDSVVYTLNVETITDEVAYNDAMNKYNYQQQEYDKAIADINAQTEILQAQDRELELRLEQLNTEQSALQNEMEAVKKVVDKHVETGFKTFGG